MLNGYAGIGGSANPILINCIFSGNSTVRFGGGMYNEYSSPIITNCTFTGNEAERGGGICSDRGSSPTLTNCILWSNIAVYGDEIYLSFYSEQQPSAITVSFSDVQGGAEDVYVETGSMLNWEVGNIDADPCFVEPGYWDVNSTPGPPPPGPLPPGPPPPGPPYCWIDGDYHLLPDSPCIDAGDPNYVAEPNETDLDGSPRVIGGRIDMGAYEYSPPIPAEVRIVPRTFNLASKGNWVTCYIWPPDDYDVADIEPNSVVIKPDCGPYTPPWPPWPGWIPSNEPNDIYPELIWFEEQEQVAVAKFKRSDVQAILEVGEVELTVTGQLLDGTVFEGTDTIKVINKGRNNK
ncbi:hypothetical protein ES703_13579 [subsurface metagenome]